MPARSILAATAAGLAMMATAAVLSPTPAFAQDDMMSSSMEASVNAPYTAFLQKYLVEKDGIQLVRYADVTPADKTALDEYIATLEGLAPSEMSRDEALAYYFNLYNAETISLILDAYPVKSIRSLGIFNSGPWKKKVVTVEGRELSLDDIEHNTVRANYDEPRVHYAFNCASIGCPNLKPSAWEAATLDADLDAAARTYIAHPRGITIENGRVTASNIYDWFSEDFGDNESEVLDHIRQYAQGDKAEALVGVTKIDRYAYDWDLNLAE